MSLPLTLATSGDTIASIVVVGGLAVATIAIVAGTVRRMHQTRERERTKREVAAYVAEGSMTPDEGERLIKADMPVWEKGRG